MRVRKTFRLLVPVLFSVVTVATGTSSALIAESQQPPKTAQKEEKSRNPVTDAWITMKIHSQFIPEDVLEDSDIDVDTTGGMVTLSGTVASEAGRVRAMALAKATDGVKGVTDKLRVAPDRSGVGTAARDVGRDATDATKRTGRRVNDGWIKSKVYAQFLTENALEDSNIDIDVAQGIVTLNGTVRSDAGRQRAVAVAKATDGVKSVKDALKIAPR